MITGTVTENSRYYKNKKGGGYLPMHKLHTP
jgi:hypothetical protein